MGRRILAMTQSERDLDSEMYYGIVDNDCTYGMNSAGFLGNMQIENLKRCKSPS